MAKHDKCWFGVAKNAMAFQGTTYAAEINIYDEIGFWGFNAQDLIDEIDGITGRILVRISSPGGEVKDGIAIYNRLRSHAGGVDTVTDSWAASIASVIFLAGDRRFIQSSGFVMVHRAASMAYGDAKKLRKYADDLEKIEGSIRTVYSERTTADEGTVAGWMDGEDHWLDAAEARQYGFATDTITASQPQARATVEALMRQFKTVPQKVAAIFNQVKNMEELAQLKAELTTAQAELQAAKSELTQRDEALNATKAKLTEAEAKITEINAAAAKQRKEAITAKVEDAVNAGRIKADAKDGYITACMAMEDDGKSLIDGLPEVKASTAIPFSASGANPSGTLKNLTQACVEAKTLSK